MIDTEFPFAESISESTAVLARPLVLSLEDREFDANIFCDKDWPIRPA